MITIHKTITHKDCGVFTKFLSGIFNFMRSKLQWTGTRPLPGYGWVSTTHGRTNLKYNKYFQWFTLYVNHMNCKKCNGNIPQRIEIDGKRYILKNRKYCLICSPFKVRTSRDESDASMIRKCSKCGNEHNDRQRKICTSCRTTMWRHNTKKKLVAYKGGSCKICGYDRCIENLTFHHLDPSEKEFSISCAGKGIEFLMREVDKCVLLCCRCHGEVHHGIATLPTNLCVTSHPE